MRIHVINSVADLEALIGPLAEGEEPPFPLCTIDDTLSLASQAKDQMSDHERETLDDLCRQRIAETSVEHVLSRTNISHIAMFMHLLARIKNLEAAVAAKEPK